MSNIGILLIAVLMDVLIGDPQGFPHPIIYIGKLIKKIENFIRKQNVVSEKFGGYILLSFSILVVVFVINSILYLALKVSIYLEIAIKIYLLYTALASKCLHVEAKKVFETLKCEDIKKARVQISYLVGRDTTSLTKSEIIRATVETVAENTIDGILAPLFYILIGFLIGYPVESVFIYKTVNTLDSMVGYIQEPYKDIGFACAKFDDVLNYLPARFGSILMIIGGGFCSFNVSRGLYVLKRDKRNHKSPNCAYPESAVAGMLGIQLGGTNTYFGQKLYKPTIGDRTREISEEDIIDTIKIMYCSMVVSVIISVVIMRFLCV